MAAGRPSKYKAEFCEQAYKLCLMGHTDEELAKFFEVSTFTISKWKIDHKEFSEALKSGKDAADGKVAESLYKRAMGYSHPAQKIFNDQGAPLVVDYIEHYPPDTTACIFWLKNRQRAKWRDKIEQEITGADGGPLKVTNITRTIVDPLDASDNTDS